jgi:YHS domain-containing protein
VSLAITLPGTRVAPPRDMSSSLLSLLWWIAIAVLFFWLMSRGGCGMMGHSHGGRAARSNGRAGHSASGNPIDPVCGMEVDPARAAATRIVGRKAYFFCSQNCLDAFDSNPSMYVHHPEHADHHGHAC